MQELIKNISKHKYLIAAVSYTLWLTAVSLTPLNGIHLLSFRMADKIVHSFLILFFCYYLAKSFILFFLPHSYFINCCRYMGNWY